MGPIVSIKIYGNLYNGLENMHHSLRGHLFDGHQGHENSCTGSAMMTSNMTCTCTSIKEGMSPTISHLASSQTIMLSLIYWQ